jgi:hypothetical protein
MESTSSITSESTNPPLLDSDMSLTHFSEWPRTDKLAFASLIVGIFGTLSILLAFISIYYAHRSERRESRRTIRKRESEIRDEIRKEIAEQSQVDN